MLNLLQMDFLKSVVVYALELWYFNDLHSFKLSSIILQVSFSKRLRLPRSNPSLETQDLFGEVWRIDKDEFLTSFAVMRYLHELNYCVMYVPPTHPAHVQGLNSSLMLFFEGLTLYNFFYKVHKVLIFGRWSLTLR